MKPRLSFYAEAPQLMGAVTALKKAVDESGLEPNLLHLVHLRASQINSCSYCVDMHSREARQGGESEQRVFLVSAWKESPLYSDRERAAFAWVEAVTMIAGRGVPDETYENALAHFSKEELVKLTVAICLINTWNRLCVSFHAIHPVEAKFPTSTAREQT